MSKHEAGVLSAALERALLVELASTWAELNANHFRGRLRKPVFALADGERRLGTWDGARRTMSFSRSLVVGRPWAVVREVLKHELAHQFVDEALGVRDEEPHGPTFQRVCAEQGFDARATGLPTDVAPETSEAPVLRKIARLLALAESPNAHEAEAATKQARRLMLKHNLEAAVASAREGYGFVHLGAPRGRVPAHEHVLAALLARHFFVDVIWVPSYLPREGKRGRVLEVCGTRSNLEVAAYVHGFLLETGERLWRAERRAKGLPGNAERGRYLLGVMTGFEEKLDADEVESQREGLVWVGDPQLQAYLRRRYPRRTSGSGLSFRRTAAYEEGREAGKGIVLRRPIHTTVDRGRLLPPA
jgi:hypothetical protein